MEVKFSSGPKTLLWLSQVDVKCINAPYILITYGCHSIYLKPSLSFLPYCSEQYILKIKETDPNFIEGWLQDAIDSYQDHSKMYCIVDQ